MKKFWMVATLLAAGLVAHGAHAALAVDWSEAAQDGEVGTVSANSMLGYAFTVAAGREFRVTALGVFDYQSNGKGDGLTQSHQVGLWDSGGSLLASLTVNSGTAGTLVESGATWHDNSNEIGGWRFVDLPSAVDLSAGSYVIGAFFEDVTADEDRYLFTSNANIASRITSLSGISVTGGRFSSLTTFGEPGAANSAYFGPSFLVDPEQVPEPATLALVGLGLAGIGAARRRKPAA